MRYFPGARQHVAALTVGAVSLAALAVPIAHADNDNDLKKKRNEVAGQIGKASKNLDEASQAAKRARRVYDAAHAELGAARSRLSDVSDRLKQARARDAELKQELAEAKQRLATAETALAEGQARTAEAKDQVRLSVLRSYNDGDLQLRAFGELLNAGSLEDLTRQLAVQDVVIGAGDRAVTDYQRSEDALATQASSVAAAKQDVAAQRASAAKHLAGVQSIYREAQGAKAEVERLVGSTRAAKKSALQVRQRDQARLRALKQREARIKTRLVEIARRARERAARSGGGFTGSSDGFLSYPANARVTSAFGYRIHPIYGYWGLHNGTDFGVACGQRLNAAAAGTVIDTYYDSVYGNRLYLNVGVVNGKSLVLIYNHMSGYVAREGERVARGEAVGYAGNTGWSTGCHLHFTVMANGVAVNPMQYL